MSVGLAVTTEQPAAAALPNPPTSVAVYVTNSTAHLSWNHGTSTLPERMYYEITATDTTAPLTPVFFGESWACKTCTMYDWPALLAGHSYDFTIRAINTQFEQSSAVTVSASIPLDGCASATALCVTVDASGGGTPNRFVGSGLLHGTESATEPNYSQFVEPLNVQQWRLDATGGSSGQASTWPYINGNSMNPSTTAIVSDAWVQEVQYSVKRPCGLGQTWITPWYNNFAYFDSWLAGLVSREVNAGRAPDYWDAMNEAGPAGPFYSTAYDPSEPLLCVDVTDENKFWGYFEHAADVLQGLGQKVIAPSYSGWDDRTSINQPTDPDEQAPLGGNAQLIDFNELLLRSRNAGVVWDGFSYHQLNGTWGGGFDDRERWRGSVRATITNASQMRALIQNYPEQTADIFINEYNGAPLPPVQNVPGGHSGAGRMAGYFFGVTMADPVEANFTCAPYSTGGNPGALPHTDCSNGSLDGLLDIDGNGDPHKRPAWHVYEKYGEMAGEIVETASTNAGLTAISAYDDDEENPAVRTLLGRYNYSTSGGAADVQYQFKVSTADLGTDVTVTIQRIPNGDATYASTGLPAGGDAYAPLDNLPSAASCNTSVNGSGVGVATIDDFLDNDAYFVTVTPQSGSYSAC